MAKNSNELPPLSMNNLNTTIASFCYLKGRSATNKLKQLFGIEKDTELADLLDIPRGTLTTWHQRNLTPYELILRVSLATGASIKALALGQGELFDQNNAYQQLILVPTKRIFSGQLEELKPTALDKFFIPEQFSTENLALFITDNSRYIVDCSHNDIIQGRYIIEIDESYSLNALQRLPDNKIAMQIIDTPIIIDSSKINIIGKVICSINQEY